MTKRINPKIDSRLIPRFDVDAILALQASAHTDRQIAKLVGINHKTVAYWRRKHGLAPNGQARRRLDIVDSSNARCTRCGLIKPLSSWRFEKKKTARPYRMSFCQECRRKGQNDAFNKSEQRNLRTRYTRLKFRSTKLGIIFDLSFNEFWAQWQSQQGKCFYTDQPLVTAFGQGKSPHACSVDKVEPTLGYVSCNVVFACNRANTIKHDITLAEMRAWMPDWYRRIMAWRAAGVPCAQVAEGDF